MLRKILPNYQIRQFRRVQHPFHFRFNNGLHIPFNR